MPKLAGTDLSEATGRKMRHGLRGRSKPVSVATRIVNVAGKNRIMAGTVTKVYPEPGL